MRRLRLTSPLTTGADVTALQRSINNRRAADHDHLITVDGHYGPATATAMRDIAYRLGLLTSSTDQGATPGVQRIIAHPSLRTPSQLARAASRKKVAATHGVGPAASLKWATSKLGVKEQPSGSNRGPQIDDWQKAVGMGAGPWCGAFAVRAALAGGAHITQDARYTPSIIAHARAGTGGYSVLVSAASRSAQPGDHVVYDWQPGTGADHVGVLESIDYQARTVTCIEGNTAVGNDSNGGEVMRRTRSFNFVLGIAVVRWA